MSTDPGQGAQEALRARVRADIKQEVPNSVWNAVDHEWKEAAVNGGQGAFNDLVDQVRKFLRVRADGAGRRQKPPDRAYRQPKLPAREEKRSSVLMSEYLRLARKMHGVQEFRERYLGNTPLTPDEVSRFLRSEIYRHLSGTEIMRRGLPTSGVWSRAAGRRTETIRLPDETYMAVTRVRLECAWSPEHSAAIVVNVPVLPSTDSEPWRVFHGRLQGRQEAFSFEYLPGSVLSDLVKVSDDLAWHFLWPVAESLIFVLTDSPVPSPAIHTDATQHVGHAVTAGRITLQIQPWTSADVVRSVYQHARRWMLGRRSRALSEAALAEFARVSELRLAKPDAGWPELAASLSRGGRERWRAMRQQYVRTEISLLRPRYAMGATPTRTRSGGTLVSAGAALPRTLKPGKQ